MISFDLTGKTAIVTGAASGLGKAIAIRLSEAGCAVAIADWNYDGAVEVAKELEEQGAKAKAFRVDITDGKAVFEMVDEVVEDFGKLDIMVNNAGIGLMKPVLALTQEEIDRLIDIDLKGVINGCRASLKHMIEQNDGRIVNMSSVAAKVGGPNASIYAAAKAGVLALSNSLAREVAQNNVNINAICPGIIRTNMWEQQLELMTNGGTEEEKGKVFQDFSNMQIPLQRPQEPEDIANMVLVLVSEFGKNVTGQSINVDGGIVIS